MERGDHIFVRRYRGLYSHHGIDCGDGSVIHYSGEDWERPTVRRSSAEEFAGDDEIEVRSYGALERSASEARTWVSGASTRFHRVADELRGLNVDAEDLTPDAVVARAESRLGEGEFDFVMSNCEHFASWCKTGLSSSKQIDALWRLMLEPVPLAMMRSGSFMTRLFDDSSNRHWRRFMWLGDKD
jgi:hypothetical protein